MNKMSIDFEERIIEVKVNKQKIRMKTYISIAEEVAFTQVCLNYFNKEGAYRVGIVKRLFDLCVLAKLTSIKIDGINIKENKDKQIEFDIDMSKGNWDALDSVGVTSNLLAFVANYNSVWDNIKTALSMQNVKNSFSDLAESLPNFDDMGNAVKVAVDSIVKLRENNPKKFDMVVENIAKNNEIKNAKKEAKKKTKKSKGE